jgi:hypothetical protein
MMATTRCVLAAFLVALPAAASAAGIEGPFVVEDVVPFVMDEDLRDLPTVDLSQPLHLAPGQPPPGWESYVAGDGEVTAPHLGSVPRDLAPPAAAGTVAAGAAAPPVFAGPPFDFPGIGFTNIHPPDTHGDVGQSHYIQVVNANPGVSSVFRIWDKNGNPLTGNIAIESLWPNGTGPCSVSGFDPVALYDYHADRWVLSQVAGGFQAQCIAVSQTGNPVTGGWFTYQFLTGGIFNDYAKLGVWPDAYYMGSQRGYPGSGADAWAFDRRAMLAGSPATFVRFFNSSTFFLPSDHVGKATPPAGAPNVFARFVDGAQFGGADRLELFAFHVDFAVPGNSTFTALPSLPTAPFDRQLCNFSLFDTCIPQPGTGVLLESLTAWPMVALQYRNFGVHETLVVNHTVDAGVAHAGIRWYELRKFGGANWTIRQQGTYAPDANHRWMGSVALDGAGNLALGYSVSSSSVFPSIRRAGRLATDPLGTIGQAEVTITPGAGSQTTQFRWGDYSAMAVDPADDRTFWYTTEWMPANGNWETRIANFSLPAGALPVQRVDNQVFQATSNVLTVACPAGTSVIGGGCNDFFTSTRLRTSAPNGQGWLCVWEDFQVNGIPLGFGAHAYCLAGNVDVGLQKVNTTTFSATSNAQWSTCPAGKRVIGGGCNDLFTSTYLRTTVPFNSSIWLCEWEHAQINGIPLGFSTDAFCINDYIDIGLQTVITQTFAATSNVQWASCPAGKRLLGGGCYDFFTSTRLRTAAPYNAPTPETWLCTWEDSQVNGIPLGFGTYALCGN